MLTNRNREKKQELVFLHPLHENEKRKKNIQIEDKIIRFLLLKYVLQI